MNYFISAREETDLKVDASELASAILARWPDARVRTPKNPSGNHALEWTFWRAGRQVEGSLDKTGHVVHLLGDVEDAAHFAIWYRSVVPPRYALVFYDEGYSVDVEIGTRTDELQLSAPFLAR